jgi:hypothetical protein
MLAQNFLDRKTTNRRFRIEFPGYRIDDLQYRKEAIHMEYDVAGVFPGHCAKSGFRDIMHMGSSIGACDIR